MRALTIPKQARGHEARDRLLAAAVSAFAERGYHGASLRDIGGPLGVANAGLLHYFPDKRALYLAVLAAIAAGLDRVADRVAAAGGGRAAAFDALFDWCQDAPEHARIVHRELVDNIGRVDRVRRWTLGPVVLRLAALVGATRPGAPRHEALLVFALIVGVVSHFAIGLPTYAGIAGRDRRAMLAEYRRVARALVSAGERD
jgi:AcrR family transcriptional regulator